MPCGRQLGNPCDAAGARGRVLRCLGTSPICRVRAPMSKLSGQLILLRGLSARGRGSHGRAICGSASCGACWPGDSLLRVRPQCVAVGRPGCRETSAAAAVPGALLLSDALCGAAGLPPCAAWLRINCGCLVRCLVFVVVLLCGRPVRVLCRSVLRLSRVCAALVGSGTRILLVHWHEVCGRAGIRAAQSSGRSKRCTGAAATAAAWPRSRRQAQKANASPSHTAGTQ
ncbi:hypothetical protein PAPHI01_2551 [Pancytospora philotis]|nr:hypothetical protein PAPHI01_2551 [Pancytospora philotis]